MSNFNLPQSPLLEILWAFQEMCSLGLPITDIVSILAVLPPKSSARWACYVLLGPSSICRECLIREGGIESHTPQAADFKFLRRPRAMTGDVISEMSGDRAAGTHRIPQSTASIQQH